MIINLARGFCKGIFFVFSEINEMATKDKSTTDLDFNLLTIQSSKGIFCDP